MSPLADTKYAYIRLAIVIFSHVFKMAFVGILSQIKLLFGPLVIQLMWYILKQLFTSVSVKMVDIYRAQKCS